MRDILPSVGLIMFLGCFSFVIIPDSEPLAPREKPVVNPAAPLTIIIDPGHGGADEGTKYYGLAEKDMTLDLALRLEAALRRLSYGTVLTRRDDRYISLADRVAIANRVENAIFVSLHFNQSTVSTVSGAETYFADEKLSPVEEWTWIGLFNHDESAAPLDRGEALASFIQESLVSRMEATNRGIKSKPLYVVRHTRCPAALVEAGFISNPMENQLLRGEDYRQRLANSIAEGLLNYVRSIPPAPPATSNLASALKE